MPLTPSRLLRAPSKYALGFDGVDDYVEIPHSESLNIVGGWTVGCWVHLLSFTKGTQIVAKGDTIGGAMYGIGEDNVGSYKFQWVGTVNGVFRYSSVFAPSLNVWYHIFNTFDTVWARSYINGVQVWSTNAWPGNTSTSTNPIRIARWGTRQAENIIIGEVRVYSRALSADEILWNYNYPGNPVRNGLVLWLPGADDAIQPPTWYDRSGFSNNGTIYGAVKTQLIQAPSRQQSPTRVQSAVR